ncbi:hypothetical protein F5Y16DRAFT_374383 [Xylariaceae sp. FL0255]|nr:hypothetical protein F5Y16DRAFT_374383 [Xylariaceae sp. FL0255]
MNIYPQYVPPTAAFQNHHSTNREPTIQHPPWRPSSTWDYEPLPLNTPAEVQNVFPVLLRERLGYLATLTFLGFNEYAGYTILQYWITLKLGASAGGPYKLIGVALAAIAELGEVESCTRSTMTCRSQWRVTFARMLTHETLMALQRIGVYDSPTFSQAKWMVYRLMMERWEELTTSDRLNDDGHDDNEPTLY